MAKNNQNDQAKKSKNPSPAAAGIIGAAAGAVAGAAAVALADKENRKKLGQAVHKVQEKGMELKERLEKEARKVSEETQDKLSQGNNRKLRGGR